MFFLLVLLLLAAVVAVRYNVFGDLWWMSNRTIVPALTGGGIGFALGFFGPMLLDPSSGNGPLLGIFITGPLGFVAGLCWGVWKEWERRQA
ncbi:MAG: hypothetical protein ACREOF_22255 [Gemmatimonadales bacterium]